MRARGSRIFRLTCSTPSLWPHHHLSEGGRKEESKGGRKEESKGGIWPRRTRRSWQRSRQGWGMWMGLLLKRGEEEEKTEQLPVKALEQRAQLAFPTQATT